MTSPHLPRHGATEVAKNAVDSTMHSAAIAGSGGLAVLRLLAGASIFSRAKLPYENATHVADAT
mgnify:CR=1 FL=1